MYLINAADIIKKDNIKDTLAIKNKFKLLRIRSEDIEKRTKFINFINANLL